VNGGVTTTRPETTVLRRSFAGWNLLVPVCFAMIAQAPSAGLAHDPRDA
jgi:hypothetical protein